MRYLRHAVAPDLIGWLDGDTSHCIWKRQPESADEIDQAIHVFAASCVGCHRYAGDDPEIIKRIGWNYCDAPQPFVESISCNIWAALRRFFRSR